MDELLEMIRLLKIERNDPETTPERVSEIDAILEQIRILIDTKK
jgi:hypothetical protein